MSEQNSKTVWITGVTSGIGYATALCLAEDGWKVIGLGRRQERLNRLQSQILALGKSFFPIVADIRDRNTLQQAFDHLPDAWKKVDALVNNAGLALGRDPVQSANFDEWQVVLDTNIGGMLHCTHMVLPGMIERNHGHIINIGSVAAHWPYRGSNVYGASKAFLAQWTRNIKCDLLGTRIRVSQIDPGMVETEFSMVRYRGDRVQAQAVYQNLEVLQPQDIAETVRWILNQPPHVNINAVEIMGLCQAWGAFEVIREKS